MTLAAFYVIWSWWALVPACDHAEPLQSQASQGPARAPSEQVY